MKVSCEVCRKTFTVEDGKLSSRGATVYCPRCKHAHLVRRVVEPYPVDHEFHESSGEVDRPLDGGSTIKVDKKNRLGVFFKSSGELEVKPETNPDERQEKKAYRWKDYLKKQGKRKLSYRTGGGTLKTLGQLILMTLLLGLVAGYLYFQTLSDSEKLTRIEWGKRWVLYFRSLL
jgi:predicted Zn finger-like uncharacterized protein